MTGSVSRRSIFWMNRPADHIDLGKALSLRVPIEGIEHAHEYGPLGRIGADMAQGFYMQRPLPESEYLDWKRQHSTTSP